MLNKFCQVFSIGDEHRQRLMIRSLFYFKDPVYSPGVQGICSQSIKILGGENNDPAVFYDLRARIDVIISGI